MLRPLLVALLLLAPASAHADERTLEQRVDDLEKRTLVQTSGFVDVDWVPFRQSSEDELTPEGQPLNENRFLLRRARLIFDRDYECVHGTVMIDANTIRGPQVRPWNAELSFKYPADVVRSGPIQPTELRTGGPYVIVSAGLLLTPFGFEVQEIDLPRPFLERSTAADALFPQSYDLGVRVLGGWRWVSWALGIMNGDPIGEQTFPGQDPNKSKDLVFRVGGRGSIADRVTFAAGISGLTGRGFHSGTPGTKDQLVWRDQNENGLVETPELQSLPGSPATPSRTFSRFAVGADARIEVALPVVGNLALRAEVVRAQNLDRGLFVADPVASTRDLREVGWYVGATQELGPYAYVGVRHDLYRPDDDASEQRPFAVVPVDTSLHTTSFVLAGRLPRVGRLVAQYDLRRNQSGRGTNGEPTNLKDDSFTLRAELVF